MYAFILKSRYSVILLPWQNVYFFIDLDTKSYGLEQLIRFIPLFFPPCQLAKSSGLGLEINCVYQIGKCRKYSFQNALIKYRDIHEYQIMKLQKVSEPLPG